jgi:serine/threonine-protein kinase RsbW
VTGQIVFEHGLKDWPLLDQFIQSVEETHPLSDKAKFALRLVLSEAIANAIKHGNRNEEGKKVWLNWTLNYPDVELNIQDEGKGFEFDEVSDPTQIDLLQREGGRGVFLLKKYCVAVEYEHDSKNLRCHLKLDV